MGLSPVHTTTRISPGEWTIACRRKLCGCAGCAARGPGSRALILPGGRRASGKSYRVGHGAGRQAWRTAGTAQQSVASRRPPRRYRTCYSGTGHRSCGARRICGAAAGASLAPGCRLASAGIRRGHHRPGRRRGTGVARRFPGAVRLRRGNSLSGRSLFSTAAKTRRAGDIWMPSCPGRRRPGLFRRYGLCWTARPGRAYRLEARNSCPGLPPMSCR